MPTNLLVEKNVDTVITLMERAKKAGYNGMVITDSKFSILDQMPKSYTTNVERVKSKGVELGLQITPMVASVGWADGLLSHDVNLIEGQPVKKAPFVVKGGVLTPVKEIAFANGELEQVNGEKLVGFAYQDGPGKTSFSDTEVKHGGARSIRFENFKADNGSGNARVMHALKVRPWQQYRVQFWLKTDHVQGDLRCFAMAEGNKVLSFMDLGSQPTQDWTKHTIIFNSQGFDKCTLYTGCWSGGTGKFWLDDFSVDEAGFLNVLRRPGTPLKLETESGKVLEEGNEFDKVADPKLGITPWPGEYTYDQAMPLIKTRLPEGTKVFASFTHAVGTDLGKTTICPSEPKTMETLASEMKAVNDLWKPKGLFLSHDEIRVANECPLCVSRGMTPGEIYAQNLRQCTNMGKKLVPGGMMLVWSDMFDPSHNAHDDYYLSNGTWAGSWKGVASDLTIMNWNSGKPNESLPFFAGLGCKQILSGFYDAPVDGIKPWLAAAKNVKGVEGVMYTTWVNDYSKLEAFAKVAFNRQ